MEADLIHAGAVLAFGGFAGSFWAGLRDEGRVFWLFPAFFLLAAAVMAAWH